MSTVRGLHLAQAQPAAAAAAEAEAARQLPGGGAKDPRTVVFEHQRACNSCGEGGFGGFGPVHLRGADPAHFTYSDGTVVTAADALDVAASAEATDHFMGWASTAAGGQPGQTGGGSGGDPPPAGIAVEWQLIVDAATAPDGWVYADGFR